MIKLHEELSLTQANKDIIKLADGDREPYRKIIADISDRLEGTIDWAYSVLNKNPRRTTKIPFLEVKELLDPLVRMYKSLVETKNENVADGCLIDIIRRV